MIDHRPEGIAVIGATGSVGNAALWVCRRFPARFRVVALAARSRASDMAKLAAFFQPELVAFSEPLTLPALPEGCVGIAGPDALLEVVRHPDVEHVVFASSGTGAISALQEALRLGKRVSLANKESIVVAGEWVLPLVSSPDQLRPVDSEHNAIWQCLAGEARSVDRIWLTASGGPFRQHTLEQLQQVKPQDALKHPVWAMGAKITIDSATLMNKGIELLEAMRLFDLPVERVGALVHPGSLVHGIVRFQDGCSKMLLSTPDMRVPAAVAMAWPERLHLLDTELPAPGFGGLDLHFENPDLDRFPCLALALEAAAKGGPYPALLVGADEIAVQAFLQERIGFYDIASVVEKTLEAWSGGAPKTLDEAVELVAWAERHAASLCGIIKEEKS